MKKFKVVTLGCRTNQYESQAFADQLKEMGYRAVEEGEEADLCIVNTCTVTAHADRSSRHEIRSLLRQHPQGRIAVTGCMAERVPEELKRLSPRLEIISNQDKEELVPLLFPEEESLPEFQIKTFDDRTRAFVKVQDGCNSFCTYCIIPYVRGRSRSRPIEEIVHEVEGLVKGGFQEVVITGINVGDFDGGGTLADLVRAVDEVEGLKALRISSIDPDEVNDDLLRAVLEGKTTCPSMHIVLQSGSNTILKRMNRKYTRQIFLDTVAKLVEKEADFTVTTDVIVGFPGETEDDFAETLEIVEKVGFAKIHVFPYSPRARTRAALYPNQIADAIMQKRKRALLEASERAAFHLRERFVGRVMPVLLEGGEDKETISGHTPNFLSVKVAKGSLHPNLFVQVKLLENRPDGFWGEVL